MGIISKVSKLLKKGGTEAKKKEGNTFASLSKTEQNTLRRKVAGTNDTDALKKQGYTTQQINTAREQIRTSKGGRGAAQLKKATERTEARKNEKAKRAEKAAKETVVQTGSVGTKSVSKKPSIALSRPRGGSMADTRKGVMRETKEAGRDTKGTMQYEKAEIKLKDDRPSRAQQMAQGKKPVTKSESARKAATTRKETAVRMESAVSKAVSDGDIDAFYNKMPGGEKQAIERSASLSSNPEERKRTLILQRMKDAGITGAELAKNYRKGGIAMKGKK